MEDATRSISHKPPIRKSSRKRTTRDFFDQQTGTEPNTNKWLKMLEGKPILKESFKRMKGEDVCLAWIEQDPHAMEEPIVIETPEGLGVKMPPVELSVADISETLGEETPIEVIGLTFVSYRVVPCLTVLHCRCIHSIEFPRLDYWKMGKLFLDRACFSRQGSKCDFIGNFRDRSWRSGSSAQTCSRLGLGREPLASLEERKGEPMA